MLGLIMTDGRIYRAGDEERGSQQIRNPSFSYVLEKVKNVQPRDFILNPKA